MLYALSTIPLFLLYSKILNLTLIPSWVYCDIKQINVRKTFASNHTNMGINNKDKWLASFCIKLQQDICNKDTSFQFSKKFSALNEKIRGMCMAR